MPVQETETVKQSNKERLKEITDSIEKRIKELFESDKYKQYPMTMRRFHSYSVNNQMLIYMQMPNAMPMVMSLMSCSPAIRPIAASCTSVALELLELIFGTALTVA